MAAAKAFLIVAVLCGLAAGAIATMQGAAWTSGAVVDKYGIPTKHGNLKCWLNDDTLQSFDSNSLQSQWADSSEAEDGACSFQVRIIGACAGCRRRDVVASARVVPRPLAYPPCPVACSCRRLLEAPSRTSSAMPSMGTT